MGPLIKFLDILDKEKSIIDLKRRILLEKNNFSFLLGGEISFACKNKLFFSLFMSNVFNLILVKYVKNIIVLKV